MIVAFGHFINNSYDFYGYLINKAGGKVVKFIKEIYIVDKRGDRHLIADKVVVADTAISRLKALCLKRAEEKACNDPVSLQLYPYVLYDFHRCDICR